MTPLCVLFCIGIIYADWVDKVRPLNDKTIVDLDPTKYFIRSSIHRTCPGQHSMAASEIAINRVNDRISSTHPDLRRIADSTPNIAAPCHSTLAFESGRRSSSSGLEIRQHHVDDGISSTHQEQASGRMRRMADSTPNIAAPYHSASGFENGRRSSYSGLEIRQQPVKRGRVGRCPQRRTAQSTEKLAPVISDLNLTNSMTSLIQSGTTSPHAAWPSVTSLCEPAAAKPPSGNQHQRHRGGRPTKRSTPRLQSDSHQTHATCVNQEFRSQEPPTDVNRNRIRSTSSSVFSPLGGSTGHLLTTPVAAKTTSRLQSDHATYDGRALRPSTFPPKPPERSADVNYRNRILSSSSSSSVFSPQGGSSEHLSTTPAATSSFAGGPLQRPASVDSMSRPVAVVDNVSATSTRGGRNRSRPQILAPLFCPPVGAQSRARMPHTAVAAAVARLGSEEDHHQRRGRWVSHADLTFSPPTSPAANESVRPQLRPDANPIGRQPKPFHQQCGKTVSLVDVTSGCSEEVNRQRGRYVSHADLTVAPSTLSLTDESEDCQQPREMTVESCLRPQLRPDAEPIGRQPKPFHQQCGKTVSLVDVTSGCSRTTRPRLEEVDHRQRGRLCVSHADLAFALTTSPTANGERQDRRQQRDMTVESGLVSQIRSHANPTGRKPKAFHQQCGKTVSLIDVTSDCSRETKPSSEVKQQQGRYVSHADLTFAPSTDESQDCRQQRDMRVESGLISQIRSHANPMGRKPKPKALHPQLGKTVSLVDVTSGSSRTLDSLAAVGSPFVAPARSALDMSNAADTTDVACSRDSLSDEGYQTKDSDSGTASLSRTQCGVGDGRDLRPFAYL